MRCQPCALNQKQTEAVALCPHCLVALCLEHQRQQAAGGPGGTGLGCSHSK